jgi:hypothetical protein
LKIIKGSIRLVYANYIRKSIEQNKTIEVNFYNLNSVVRKRGITDAGPV